eukprot:TRINITY_DN208_c0_g1_i1.p2 TRINITY_DN208_c0_g1~~TRINITY_DN208_c0_g1_i1.p2  ORF type:complete len:172 (-),score=29.98 TRINITY_DN208_c0_g1_i1:691-1206(-)
MKTVTFDLFPGRTLSLFLFKDVNNAAVLKKRLMAGELVLSLIDPKMIVDEFQLLIAATRVLSLEKAGKLWTKGIHPELVFTLAGHPKISKAFASFGLKSDSSLLVVCVFDATPEIITQVPTLVQGIEIDIKKLSQIFDEAAVKKEYGITETELNRCNLLDAVVARIAVRDS